MTTYVPYGGSAADLLFTINTTTGDVKPAAGGTAGVWTAPTGGSAITDLQTMSGAAITHITAAADGTFAFQAPEGLGTLYVDSGLPSGSRFACQPTGLATVVAGLSTGGGGDDSAAITELQSDVTGIGLSLNNLGSSLSGVQGDVGALGATVAGHTSTIAALQAAVTALQQSGSGSGGGSGAGPTGLTATPGNGQIVLTWTLGTQAGITGQYLAWSPASTQGDTNSTLDASTTTYTVDHLTNTESYSFSLAPITSAGTGSVSTTVTSAPVAPIAPGVPTDLTATPGDGQVSLTWTASTGDVAGYTTQYRTSPSGSWTTVPGGNYNGTSVIVTGLADGTAYDFQVAGYDSEFDTSAYCSPVTATPAASSGGSGVLLSDDFNRADGPIGSTDGGSGPAQAWSCGSIASHLASDSQSVAPYFALVDPGHVGGTYEMTLGAVYAGVGIVVRVNESTSTCIRFHLPNSADYGSSISGGFPGSPVPAVGDVMKVIDDGSTLTYFVNGTQVGSDVSSLNAGLTPAGFTTGGQHAVAAWSYSTATS